MATVIPTSIRKTMEAVYRTRTSKSRELYSAAASVMPGGDTRSALHFSPYPTFMERGYGCRIRDVDQNEYIDFLNNYSSLVHGHAHPLIIKAISDQVARGTAFASPIGDQTRLARLLVDRVGSLEQVRFCNSGTEATMMAIRVAKAFTGRNKILKLEGGYHGTHDAAFVNTASDSNTANSKKSDNFGLFRGIVEDVLSTPANDIPSAREALVTAGHDLAAVIVEPVMGGAGIIPLETDFLNFLSATARAWGAVLIFDEVITFRLAYGGAQGSVSIKPDLTTLGKLIGGGLPVGAFGGRGEIMDLFHPTRGRLSHSGTFNGNAATVAAGIASLELLTHDAIAHINRLGNQLRDGLQRIFKEMAISAQVTGVGSLTGIHFTKDRVTDYKTALKADKEMLSLLHLGLMNRGIFIAPRGFLCTSAAMSESDVEQLIEACKDSLTEIGNDS